MDVRTSDEYYHFVYDPNLYGLNTAYWQALNGTASLTGANKIRANSVTIVTKHQYFHGDFTLSLNVPSLTGGLRRWGLIDPALSTNQNALYFEQNLGVFQAVVINDAGTQTTYPITWDATNWNGLNIEYKIEWSRNTATFSIAGVQVAVFQDRNLTPGYVILPISITNNEADSLDLNYIIGKHIEKVQQPAWELPVASTPTTTPTTNQIESVMEGVTITENVKMLQTSFPNVSDSTAITESVSVLLPFFKPIINDTATITESVTVVRI